MKFFWVVVFFCLGIIVFVVGIVYDLRMFICFGDCLKNVNNGKGYDMNFCVGG